MSPKIPVTVLGATGVVGQRFVRRLAHHPYFVVQHLAASERSEGKRYRDACAWRLDGEPYGGLGEHVLVEGSPEQAYSPVVFSALDTGPAKEAEPAFAKAGALVFSNAAAFRMAETVPLLVPEVNPDHLGLLEAQRRHHGWKGGIVTNPNCTATVLVMALAPLQAAFGIEAVLMTSMQAVSGAGYPGVPPCRRPCAAATTGPTIRQGRKPSLPSSPCGSPASARAFRRGTSTAASTRA